MWRPISSCEASADGAPTEILVAIDVGTSGARAAAFGLEGNRLLEVRQGYPTASVATGWAEQDPRAWRRAALSALEGLVAQLGAKDRVAAIGLTGQCPSVCLVDAKGAARHCRVDLPRQPGGSRGGGHPRAIR